MTSHQNSFATVATIGIDIGKTTFHLIGQDRRGAACGDRYRRGAGRDGVEAVVAGESQQDAAAVDPGRQRHFDQAEQGVGRAAWFATEASGQDAE